MHVRVCVCVCVCVCICVCVCVCVFLLTVKKILGAVLSFHLSQYAFAKKETINASWLPPLPPLPFQFWSALHQPPLASQRRTTPPSPVADLLASLANWLEPSTKICTSTGVYNKHRFHLVSEKRINLKNWESVGKSL